MKNIYMFVVVFLSLTAGLLLGQQKTSAQTTSFERVIPFSTPAGMQGFFDQKTGTLYFYDENLKNCILKTRLQELGKPMQSVQ